jgi:hypothetical protein
VREGSEVCDGTDLAGETCESQGLDGGTLACNATCDGFLYTDCTGGECGDGLVSGTEQCDGLELLGNDCTTIGGGFDGGTLACADDCTFDTSACTGGGGCGDGVIEDPEVCDGDNLGDPARTCADEGFRGGIIACADDCLSFDTSGCTNETDCGNGETEFPEECDGTVPTGVDCTSRGFTSGTIACTDDCTLDVSGCVAEYCGDDAINGTEECDGSDLGSPAATCSDEGFSGGTIACADDCTLDVSSCTGGCGNGVTDGSDVCDGLDVGTRTCADEGFHSGLLACASDCSAYDTSACITETPTCTVDGADLGDLSAGDVVSTTGDTTSATDDVTVSCTDAAATATRDVAYEIVLMERGRLGVRTDNTWHVVSLMREASSSTSCFTDEVRCADPFFEGNPLDFGVLDPGRYYIVVSDYSEAISQEYGLVVTMTAEGGEVCNNGVSDDGDSDVDCADADCTGSILCDAEVCTGGTDEDLDFAVDCMDDECVGTGDCTGGSCTADTDLGTLVVGTVAGALIDLTGESNDHSLDCTPSDGNDHVFRFVLDAPRKILARIDQSSGSDQAVGLYYQGGTGTGCTDLESICLDMSTLDDSPDINGWLSTSPYPAGTYYFVVEATTGGAGTVDVDLTAYNASELDCTDGVDDDNDGVSDCADFDCIGTTACTGSSCTPDHDLGTLTVGTEVTHTTDTSSATNSLHLSCATSDGGDFVYSFSLSADSYVYTTMDQPSGTSHAVALAFQGGTGTGCGDVENLCLELAAGDFTPDASGYFSVDAPLPAGTYYIIYEVTSSGGSMDLVLRAADSLSESSCTDGVDNDGDGAVDCEDDQCASDPTCAGSGVYEVFEEGTSDTFDLSSSLLTFTPVPGHPDGYVWAHRAGITMFPYAAGSGTVTAPITLTDDEAAEVTFTTLGGVPFFGTAQTVLNISSNGLLTFGSGNANANYIESADGLFSLPSVAPMWDDMDPSSGGTITYDEYANRAVVTFDGVPELEPGTWTPTGSNSFQAVLWDDGHIEVAWTDVSCLDAVVGVGDGGGGASSTAESNFN